LYHQSFNERKVIRNMSITTLKRSVAEKGLDILVLVAHPGVANTELSHSMTNNVRAQPFFWMFFKLASTPFL
jgi:ATP-dependent Lon protease